jgi:hypothetical protein
MSDLDTRHEQPELDLFVDDLVPLPKEHYPRVVERGSPTKGYYVALGLVLSVWMITPLSW